MTNKMVQCQFCSFTSKQYNQLRAHEKNEHYHILEKISNKFENVKKKKNNRENFKHFTCKFCSYTSTRNYNVMRHIKQNHWRKNDENVNVNNKRERKKDDNIEEKCETNRINVDKKLEEEEETIFIKKNLHFDCSHCQNAHESYLNYLQNLPDWLKKSYIFV